VANERIGVGIIGANVNYGFGSRAHIPALAQLPEYRLAAVATTSRDTAEETAAKYGFPLAFSDVQAMVEDPSVDLVTVCVRVPAHHDYVRMALEANKHVYCEWPLGANLAEVEALSALASARGVQHLIGLQGRGSPAVNYMKDLIADGFVGKVVSCSMVATLSDAGQRPAFNVWGYEHKNGAGTLHIPAGHCLDLLCYVVGDFVELSALLDVQVKTPLPGAAGEGMRIDTPDQVLVQGRLANGAAASAHIQTAPVASKNMVLEVHGTDGMLVATGDWLWMQDIALSGLRSASKPAEQTYDNPWGNLGAKNVVEPNVLTPLTIPDSYRWVPASMPAGLPYSVGQLYRRLGQAIRGGERWHPDFAVAMRRASLLATLERASSSGMRQKCDF
jgi:predicted dehydrogenase